MVSRWSQLPLLMTWQLTAVTELILKCTETSHLLSSTATKSPKTHWMAHHHTAGQWPPNTQLKQPRSFSGSNSGMFFASLKTRSKATKKKPQNQTGTEDGYIHITHVWGYKGQQAWGSMYLTVDKEVSKEVKLPFTGVWNNHAKSSKIKILQADRSKEGRGAALTIAWLGVCIKLKGANSIQIK